MSIFQNYCWKYQIFHAVCNKEIQARDALHTEFALEQNRMWKKNNEFSDSLVNKVYLRKHCQFCMYLSQI